MILVDTNIWIQAFNRHASDVTAALSVYVLDKQACMTGVIRAELLSGVRNESEYHFLENRLLPVPVLEGYPALWDDVARARFRLARLGIQAGLMDLSIACHALHHHTPLWTRDQQFNTIHNVVPFKVFQP